MRDAARVMEAALERLEKAEGVTPTGLVPASWVTHIARDALAEVRALPASNTETGGLSDETKDRLRRHAMSNQEAAEVVAWIEAAEARLAQIAELADGVLGELDDLVVEREEWADTHGDVFQIRRFARGEEARS